MNIFVQRSHLRPKVRMAAAIFLDCDAKVRCDYATEKYFFNRKLHKNQEAATSR